MHGHVQWIKYCSADFHFHYYSLANGREIITLNSFEAISYGSKKKREILLGTGIGLKYNIEALYEQWRNWGVAASSDL